MKATQAFSEPCRLTEKPKMREKQHYSGSIYVLLGEKERENNLAVARKVDVGKKKWLHLMGCLKIYLFFN